MPWKDVEKKHEYNRRWREKNPDYQRHWYQENIERIRKQQREYYQKNREKIRAWQHRWYKSWLAKNPEKREQRNRYNVEYRHKLRQDVLSHYGAKCACCGEKRNEFLAVDHTRGGGNKHRKAIRIGSGFGFYLWLQRQNYPKDFRILCHNCNFALGHYGYCPHQSLLSIPAK